MMEFTHPNLACCAPAPYPTTVWLDIAYTAALAHTVPTCLLPPRSHTAAAKLLLARTMHQACPAKTSLWRVRGLSSANPTVRFTNPTVNGSRIRHRVRSLHADTSSSRSLSHLPFRVAFARHV